MYEMKVQSLPDVFTNYFRSIATINSYNTRQASSDKYCHPRTKLGRKCFVKAAKKHLFNLQE